MLSQVMQDAINEQINNELFASYNYLSMSAWCGASTVHGLCPLDANAK